VAPAPPVRERQEFRESSILAESSGSHIRWIVAFFNMLLSAEFRDRAAGGRFDVLCNDSENNK